MNISTKGLDLIKFFEGFKEDAYDDGFGVITIGYGTIKYTDGTSVRMGDHCTKEQAERWLFDHIQGTVEKINKLTWNNPLSQCQFDALCSFAYNLGLGALTTSTLYMKARQNPNDETIYKYDENNPARTCEFTKWITVKGKAINGLLNRRRQEADLYGSTA